MKYLLALLIVFTACNICQAELQILGEESPPGEYIDNNGKPAGVTIDLVEDLLRRQGAQATIKILPWKRAYYIGLNHSNVALMETTRTEEREELFRWVGPILVVNRIIYGRADFSKPVNTIEDIPTAENICVLRGSSNESYLNSLGFTRISSVAKPFQCIKMLMAGHVQLFYTSEIGMDGLLKEQGINPDKFKIVLNLKKEYLYLAFSRDVSDVRINGWQTALEDAKKDGTVFKIYQSVYPDGMIKEICLPGDPLAQ